MKIKDIFSKLKSNKWNITWNSYWFTTIRWRMKIEKVEKLIASLHNKMEYITHIRDLKQVLNHELFLKLFIEWLNLITMRRQHHIMIWRQIWEKQQKITLRKTFPSWWIMRFLAKLWKMWENTDILSLSQ